MKRFALALVVLAALAATPLPAPAAKPQNGRVYVTMEDGVEIAVYLEFPSEWSGSTKLPVILQYDGYEGAGGPAWHPWLDRTHYIVAHAGVRGAGCSGGRWALFSEKQAEDGAALVEWLGTRSWSDGNVGMIGHSYPGYMALFVAAQRPAHLRAITVSGTGDDIYRDVAYPGGIPSRLFGPLWLAYARPSEDYLAGVTNLVQHRQTDCLLHEVSRTPENPADHSLVNVLLQDQDSDFWFTHSPKSVVDRIQVPTQINAQSNDEQILQSTRGSSRIFQALNVSAKQLIVTNGDHNAWDDSEELAITSAKVAWLDRYLRGIPNGVDAQPQVRVLLESHFANDGHLYPTGEATSNTWPLTATTWTRLYAAADHALSETPGANGQNTFLLGTGRQLVDPTLMESGKGTYAGERLFQIDGPDMVVYQTRPAATTQVFAGPMAATIFARIYSTEANWYVSIEDEAPNGDRSLLTRGYLRATHRANDPAREAWDGPVMYRPYHPDTNPTPVIPGSVQEYRIEIVPAGVVVRPGHVLRFKITATPLVQTYGVFQPAPPTIAQILHGSQYPTSLLLPLVPTPELGPEPPCGSQTAVFCAKPLA